MDLVCKVCVKEKDLAELPSNPDVSDLESLLVLKNNQHSRLNAFMQYKLMRKLPICNFFLHASADVEPKRDPRLGIARQVQSAVAHGITCAA
jgi:hypothetical protein